MAIFEVIYISPSGNELVSLEQIESREDFDVVKYNIYCAERGCNCRMEYVPQGVKVAYFKKWRGDEYKHSENCIHFAETEVGRRPTRRLGVESSRLRPSHKNSILKDMYKKYKETEEEREARKAKERERARIRRNRPNIRVRRNEAPIEEVVNRPTTDSSGEVLIEGDRNPPVPRNYSIIHINRDKLNSTVALIDRLIDVTNDFENSDQKRSILTISNSSSTHSLKIVLDQVFFVESPRNISRMLEILEQMVLHVEDIIVSAVGEVIERDNELCLAVYSEDGLRINGLSIFSYISRAS